MENLITFMSSYEMNAWLNRQSNKFYTVLDAGTSMDQRHYTVVWSGGAKTHVIVAE